MPLLGVKPTTLAYQEDTLTDRAAGQSQVMHFVNNVHLGLKVHLKRKTEELLKGSVGLKL